MCSCSDVLVASGVALAHATRSEPVGWIWGLPRGDACLGVGGSARDSLRFWRICLDVLALGCAGGGESAKPQSTDPQSHSRRYVAVCSGERCGAVARVVHVHNAYYWRTLKTNSNYERLFTYALPSHSPLTLPGRSPTRLEAACRCGQEKVAAPSLRPWPANDPPRVPRGC